MNVEHQLTVAFMYTCVHPAHGSALFSMVSAGCPSAASSAADVCRRVASLTAGWISLGVVNTGQSCHVEELALT